MRWRLRRRTRPVQRNNKIFVSGQWLRQAAILVLLAFAPAIGEAIYFRDKISWQSPIPPSELVTVDQARAWSDNAIWVDARPDEEFARDHVPGAVSLNEDRWSELLPQFLPKWSPEKKVVVYCSAESCNAAREVAKRLRDEAQLKDGEGKNCVFVLKGGWEEWLKKNR
jgi:rhodanese-related sulfurtransferase